MKDLTTLLSHSSSKGIASDVSNQTPSASNTSEAQQAAGLNGQHQKAGIKKTSSAFSLFKNNKDKVTYAEFEEKIAEMKDQQVAVNLAHEEETQAFHTLLYQMKNAFQAQLDEMKEVVTGMDKKHEDDILALEEGMKERITHLEAMNSDLHKKQEDEKKVYEGQLTEMKQTINDMVKKHEEDALAFETEKKCLLAELEEKYKAEKTSDENNNTNNNDVSLFLKVAFLTKKLEDAEEVHDKEKKGFAGQIADLKKNVIDLVKNQEMARHFHFKDKKTFEDQISWLKNSIKVMENRNNERAAASDKLQTLESKVLDLQYSIADMNTLVIKELELIDANVWHGYSSLDKDEEPPTILSLIDPGTLTIDLPPKKIVLNGVVSDFFTNPFEGNAQAMCNNNDGMNASRLLVKIDVCKLSDLFLYYQLLVWMDYEKLVYHGMIRNLYFQHVEIKDVNGLDVPLEMILLKLPNIEKFYYRNIGAFRIETFKNLVQLPTFKNLQEFKLTNIFTTEFDIDSFLEFMKKHPSTNFTLFFSFLIANKNEIEVIKQAIYRRCPTPFRLKIEN